MIQFVALALLAAADPAATAVAGSSTTEPAAAVLVRVSAGR
jgi:hypothetical protein